MVNKQQRPLREYIEEPNEERINLRVSKRLKARVEKLAKKLGDDNLNRVCQAALEKACDEEDV